MFGIPKNYNIKRARYLCPDWMREVLFPTDVYFSPLISI